MPKRVLWVSMCSGGTLPGHAPAGEAGDRRGDGGEGNLARLRLVRFLLVVDHLAVDDGHGVDAEREPDALHVLLGGGMQLLH